MNLKHLTDEALHQDSHRWNKNINHSMANFLFHILENDRRRLYSMHKCESLSDYIQKEFHCSGDEAQRRLSAMRLLKEIPEVETMLREGTLSMTNMVLARALFAKERKAGRAYSKSQKVELLGRFEKQSTRAAKKIAVAINPEMQTKSELAFDNIDDDALREKLLELRGAYAHSNPSMNLEQLLHKMCDEQIEICRKQKLKTPRSSKLSGVVLSPDQGERELTSKTAAPRKLTDAEVKRIVWARDGHRCTNCQSAHAVQEDHRIPKALGGEYTVENIHLLCRSCNQRAAVNAFGVGKMDPHIH